MAPLKLYYFPASPAASGSLFTARNLKIDDLEVITVDLLAGEQYEDWYKKINPQSAVPALVDNGFTVTESRAISTYLVHTRTRGSTLYPSQPRQRAVVDQRLYFDATTLFPRVTAIGIAAVFQGVPRISQENRDNLYSALETLNGFLSKSKWVAGTNITIADLHICAAVAFAVAFKAQLDDYPEVQRWFEACKALPGFSELERGANMFGAKVLEKVGSNGLSS